MAYMSRANLVSHIMSNNMKEALDYLQHNYKAWTSSNLLYTWAVELVYKPKIDIFWAQNVLIIYRKKEIS